MFNFFSSFYYRKNKDFSSNLSIQRNLQRFDNLICFQMHLVTYRLALKVNSMLKWMIEVNLLVVFSGFLVFLLLFLLLAGWFRLFEIVKVVERALK